RNEKIGVIGKNGSGKTTFLNIITGELEADSGKFEVGETVVFGYYKQDGIKFKEDQRVIDVVKEIAEVISLADGKKMTVSQFLLYFLFTHEMQYTRVEKLSGGEKRRLYLMTVLMRNPNFLILDEPTNDLDIITLNVLEEYLKIFPGCVLVVSHDRFFMDKIVDHLFVFEGEGVTRDFPGNYTQYRIKRDQEAKKIKPRVQVKTETKDTRPVNDYSARLTFREKFEFEQLETELQKLQQEKAEIEKDMHTGRLKPEMMNEKSIRYGELLGLIDEKEMRWLELSEKGGD
ncbi:MAG: ATP-binding cassette domain-containing protein, partial [Bacteroidota bacterium]